MSSKMDIEKMLLELETMVTAAEAGAWEELDKIVQKLNMFTGQSELHNWGVSDKTSGDLIRKIPGDEVLAMSARIRQYMESMQMQMQMQGKGGLDLKGLLFEGKG